MAEQKNGLPKVFISYSWSSMHHQEMVKYWADRLLHDGIDVILDIYDLNEGDEKYAFMESMVTDPSITHVLVVCDSKYTERANAREKGVGTESTIISSEVYKRVKQSKFIPILCEFDGSGEPITPAFMNARIGLDFSTPESVNENWEQLIRLLYNKPLHVKPKKGSIPSYIKHDTALPANEPRAKFESLRQAVLQEKKGIKIYRADFLRSCLAYVDELRVRERPDEEDLGQKVLNDCIKLKVIRDYICDWLLLEGRITSDLELSESLLEMLERLLEMKSKPNSLTSWNEKWFEAHSVFVYEVFLYVVAALIQLGRYELLRELYSSHYLPPQSPGYSNLDFDDFSCFHGSSELLQDVLRPGENLCSPSAELFKSQADRADLKFHDIVQAEAVTFLVAMLSEVYWYPGTLHYISHHERLPVFVRAAQHKHFEKLAKVTGVESAIELKDRFMNALSQFGFTNSRQFFRLDFKSLLNLDGLDRLK